MTKRPPFSFQAVSELLAYDPETGIFRCKVDCGNGVRAGSIAGGVNRGYRLISVLGRRLKAHRLAWLLSYGVLPPSQIDHINCDGRDNRLSNLRLATQTLNNANRRAQARAVHNLPKGVHATDKPNRFRARIKANGRRIDLGRFDTVAEARQAYMAAAIELFGPFAREE